jgi:hypothetical protein
VTARTASVAAIAAIMAHVSGTTIAQTAAVTAKLPARMMIGKRVRSPGIAHVHDAIKPV